MEPYHRRNAVLTLAFFMFGPPAAMAGSFSFTGNFSMDDEVRLFNFAVSAATPATLQTLSFAGGTNAAGNTIAAGGFTPILSLFDGTGNFLTRSADPSACGGGNPSAPDPVTGACWDAFISTALPTGNYILALTEWDNVANQPTLADGFFYDGQGNFTGPTFLGTAGSFIAPDGAQRDSHWAVDILFVDAAGTVTEPGSLGVAIAGFAAAVPFVRRRNFRRNSANIPHRS